jgi:hypothetical protein
MATDRPNLEYIPWVLDMAVISGTVGNYCDHAEHIELRQGDENPVIEAAVSLRGLAITIAQHEGKNLQTLYAHRLEEVENRSPLVVPGQPKKIDGRQLVLEAQTWRDLQLAQLAHNRQYNPDISGLSKTDQLRHFAFHASKLGKSLVEQARGISPKETFLKTRLPDMVIFSVLISTAMNQRLPETPLP